jgi:DNA-binding MarR family transcriptional regulator
MSNIQQILAYVRANEPQTADNIARNHGMKRGSVSKDLTRLVRAKKLIRLINPADKTKPLYNTPEDSRVPLTSVPDASASVAANS